MVRGFFGIAALTHWCVSYTDPLEVASQATVTRAQAEDDGLVATLQLPDGVLECLVAVVVAFPFCLIQCNPLYSPCFVLGKIGAIKRLRYKTI